jgi:hypothetical protein
LFSAGAAVLFPAPVFSRLKSCCLKLFAPRLGVGWGLPLCLWSEEYTEQELVIQDTIPEYITREDCQEWRWIDDGTETIPPQPIVGINIRTSFNLDIASWGGMAVHPALSGLPVLSFSSQVYMGL